MELLLISLKLEIAVRFIKECDFMTAVKERIIGAVSIMSDKDANILWHIIQKQNLAAAKSQGHPYLVPVTPGRFSYLIKFFSYPFIIKRRNKALLGSFPVLEIAVFDTKRNRSV